MACGRGEDVVLVNCFCLEAQVNLTTPHCYFAPKQHQMPLQLSFRSIGRGVTYSSTDDQHALIKLRTYCSVSRPQSHTSLQSSVNVRTLPTKHEVKSTNVHWCRSPKPRSPLKTARFFGMQYAKLWALGDTSVVISLSHSRRDRRGRKGSRLDSCETMNYSL
jgi:hypothetical protein